MSEIFNHCKTCGHEHGECICTRPSPSPSHAYRMISGWAHKIDCFGGCHMITGCYPQWTPEEVRRMVAGSQPRPVFRFNKLPEPAPRCVPRYEDQPGNVTQFLRDYTSEERNAIPLHTVLAEYFPDAFAALARHAKKANAKHNGPDAPMAWAREKSTDHLNKAVRHLTTPDAIDPDTGEIELIGAMWRCAAAAQLREEKRLVAAGIRPLSGVTK